MALTGSIVKSVYGLDQGSKYKILDSRTRVPYDGSLGVYVEDMSNGDKSYISYKELGSIYYEVVRSGHENIDIGSILSIRSFSSYRSFKYIVVKKEKKDNKVFLTLKSELGELWENLSYKDLDQNYWELKDKEDIKVFNEYVLSEYIKSLYSSEYMLSVNSDRIAKIFLILHFIGNDLNKRVILDRLKKICVNINDISTFEMLMHSSTGRENLVNSRVFLGFKQDTIRFNKIEGYINSEFVLVRVFRFIQQLRK